MTDKPEQGPEGYEAFVDTLVDLYRTGQLVLIDDQAVERVARGLHASRSMIPWEATSNQYIAYRDAREAITALRTKEQADG